MSDEKKFAVAPKPKDTTASNPDVEGKPKCMSCRAVAFITPLAISAYLIKTYSTMDKVLTYGVAKSPSMVRPDGKPTWRLKMHRYNMIFSAPMLIFITIYSRLFELSIHHPEEVAARKKAMDQMLSKDSNEEEPEIPTATTIAEHLEQAKEQVKHQVTRDVDSFTKGVNELADWFGSESSEKKETVRNVFKRLKLMFGSREDSKPDE